MTSHVSETTSPVRGKYEHEVNFRQASQTGGIQPGAGNFNTFATILLHLLLSRLFKAKYVDA